MSNKEYPINLGQTIVLDRKLSFDAGGNTYEEKPRSAVVAGYIEAGTPVAVVAIESQEYKGTNKFVCALPSGDKLHFHFNHLKPRESKKVVKPVVGGTVTNMVMQTVPTTATGRLQANRAQQAAILDQMQKLGEQVKALELAAKELHPLAQEEIKKLQASLDQLAAKAPVPVVAQDNGEILTEEEQEIMKELEAQEEQN